MSSLLIYAMKASLYLAALYLLYFILLSRDTAYARNRAFIILSLVSAVILPMISFHTFNPLNIGFFGKYLSGVLISAGSGINSDPASGSSSTGTFQIFYTIYIIGVIGSLFKLLTDFLNLLFLIIRQKKEGSRIIRFHLFNTSGFSAMGHIFINSKLSTEEAEEIIRHEQNHLQKNHFLDIILIEFVKAFQWFNPIIYLFNRSLRAIHEFQADQECLKSGIQVVNYQSLLLNQVFKTKAFNLTNSFSNPSLIKKRMIMMTKERTSALANIKLILVIPVIGLVFLVISAFSENPASLPLTSPVDTQDKVSDQGSNQEPFVAVEVMPEFPGGDAALLGFIANNTRYPEHAKGNNIEGRVIVRFCVTEKGGTDRITVLKGVDPELDAEAVRVIGTLPAFIPGQQSGKPVPVWYMVPITFTLK